MANRIDHLDFTTVNALKSIVPHRTIYTIGHSTHSLETFVGMLRAHGIALLADVRSFPGSRRYPHFNAESLAVELPRAGIAYQPHQLLGGRRKAAADSINTGWRQAAFRGYADYMQTPEFAEALDRLQRAAATSLTAIMCAEAVPWRCHRSLIGDALLARGWKVVDIFSATSAKPHKLTPFAMLSGDAVTYPKPADDSLFSELARGTSPPSGERKAVAGSRPDAGKA